MVRKIRIPLLSNSMIALMGFLLALCGASIISGLYSYLSVGGDFTAVVEAKQDLKRLIEKYERMDGMLERIEKDIQALLGEIPIAVQLRSIKGLASILIAAILSGAGDLRQYAFERQLLRGTSGGCVQ